MKRGGELKRYTALRTHKAGMLPNELARSTLKPGTKRMKQGHSTDKPTAAEGARIVLVKKLGCICCMLNRQMELAVAYVGACEGHHLLSGGIRRGHDFMLGLCPWHHRGVPPKPMHEREAIAMYGPSVATGSKPFHATYGSDDDLLEFQNALLIAVEAA